MRYLVLLALLAGCDTDVIQHCHDRCVEAYERAYLTNRMSPTLQADDEACHRRCNEEYHKYEQ